MWQGRRRCSGVGVSAWRMLMHDLPRLLGRRSEWCRRKNRLLLLPAFSQIPRALSLLVFFSLMLSLRTESTTTSLVFAPMWRRQECGNVLNARRRFGGTKFIRTHAPLTAIQVTGLLSLLEGLRAREDLRNSREQDRRRQHRRLRRRTSRRRRIRGEEEQQHEESLGDRRLLIVLGDFNFDSSSSGYQRLLSEAGLVSAAANCSSITAAAAAAATTAATTKEGDAGESVAVSDSAATEAVAASPTEPSPPGVVQRHEKVSRAPSPSRARAVFWGDGRGGNDRDVGAEIRGVGGVWGDDSGGDAEGDDAVANAGDGSGARGDGIDSSTAYHDADAGAVAGADDGALDFVFFEAVGDGGDGGVSCGGYEVRREFSQQRYADGYPSVTEFDVSCPLPSRRPVP